MKTRQGFVSNSSSSSFIIDKKFLSPDQLDKIRRHTEAAVELNKQEVARRSKDEEYENSYDRVPLLDSDYPWDIEETDAEITGNTSMDNFDMREFLIAIGASEHARWADGHW